MKEVDLGTVNPMSDSEELECILDEAKTSDALWEQILSTTAMMGRQHASEHGWEYTWSYHPDNGLDMTITEAE